MQKAILLNNEVIFKSNEDGVITGKLWQLCEKHVWLEELLQFNFEGYSIIEIEDDPIPEPIVVPKTAEQLRQEAELATFVEVQGHPVNLSDKAIYNLQAYILAEIAEVSWKCDDEAFVTLTQAEMKTLLTALMFKKNELFTQEMLGE